METKNYYSELKVNKYYLIALFFFSVFFVLVYSIYTSFLYSKIIFANIVDDCIGGNENGLDEIRASFSFEIKLTLCEFFYGYIQDEVSCMYRVCCNAYHIDCTYCLCSILQHRRITLDDCIFCLRLPRHCHDGE